MFCSNCGAQLIDGASFCTSCGTRVNANAQPTTPPDAAATTAAPTAAEATPSAPPAAAAPTAAAAPCAPAPAAAVPATTDAVRASNKKIMGIGIAVVAVVIAVVAIIAVMNCAGGSKVPNLNGLVSDKPEQIAASLEKLSTGELGRVEAFMANDDMKDVMTKSYEAFDNSKKDMKALKEDIQKTNPWAVGMRDNEGQALDLQDLKDGSDPAAAAFITYRVLDKPKPEDIAKIVGEAAKYDKIIVGQEGDEFTGVARTGDCVMHFSASEFQGVYQINIVCYRLDEDEASEMYEEAFDEMYDNYQDERFGFEETYRK